VIPIKQEVDMKNAVIIAVALLCGVSLAARYVSGSFVVEDGEVSRLTAVSGRPVAAGHDLEVLLNPGFESGQLPPWTTNNWVVDDKYPHSGTYCAADVGNYWIEQTFDSVPGSEVQSITFWSRQPESAIQAVYLKYGDGTRDQVIVYPTASWTLMDVTSMLNPAKVVVGIRIWGYSGGGPDPDSTYIDDVSIQVPGVVRDVGVVELVCPRDTVEFDTTHIPSARAANFGSTAETFPVIMMIEDICDPDPYYFDTVEVTVPAGDTVVVTFVPWRPRYPAMHRARCWTELPGDTNPANNMQEHFFHVARITGVAENPPTRETFGSVPTLVRSVLRLPEFNRHSTFALLNSVGREVMKLKPGENDVGHLSPGVYFVCSAGIDPLTPALSRKGRGSAKVVIAR
jgi:hypothetical protein